MLKMFLKTHSMTNGIMTWWKSVKGTAYYTVTLYIGNAEDKEGTHIAYYPIDTVETSKEKCYHTFSDLADVPYAVKVCAYSSSGVIIAQSDHSMNIHANEPLVCKVKK